MKFLLSILIITAVFDQCSSKHVSSIYGDRPCGTNISNLWLDIVLLMDISDGETESGLKRFVVRRIFNKDFRFGSNPDDPKTVQLGLVTYNGEAKVVADLDEIQSYHDLHDLTHSDQLSFSSSNKSYLDLGLLKANRLFQNPDDYRKHYKKVVIVFTSTYSGSDNSNPMGIAESLKDSGIIIITIGYDQGQDEKYLEDLSKVATPGFNFTTKEFSLANLVSVVHAALTQANCYCPPSWEQFHEPHFMSPTIRYGVCVQPRLMSTAITWRHAQKECRDSREKTSQMVTEYSESKHNFVFNMMIKHRTHHIKSEHYHIGLHKEKGVWKWPNVDLKYWHGWKEGFPISDQYMAGVQNYPDKNGTTGWVNVDIDWELAYTACERAACDTDNYCDYFDHILKNKNNN